MKLQNKVAIVTGASRGIGRAIAELLASNGAKVVVNYNKSEKAAEQMVEKLKADGFQAEKFKADVSREEEVKALIGFAVETFGGIDILVNNAGIVFDKAWTEKTVEEWQTTLATNLIGPFLTAKYAASYLKVSKSGRIINISSTNATDGYFPDSMDYDASKAGLVSLTKNLAIALAPNVLVNTVLPGWVNTDINKDLPTDYVREETEAILVKRFGEPKEIASIVLYLASEESSFVNGSVIEVDGGS